MIRVQVRLLEIDYLPKFQVLYRDKINYLPVNYLMYVSPVQSTPEIAVPVQ